MSAPASPRPADAAGDVYAGSGLPALGFRNYWYPVLASWRLRRRPRAVRILGEEIVLFRDGGKVHALQDRCPHRGARLSQGECVFPGSGTLSCPYHGWTFSGESGRCVAKLMEGPNAPMARGAAVRSYPVRELRGVLWLFVGDMDAVAMEDDLPFCLTDTGDWHHISTWRTYRCNWRVLKDNLCNDLHAPFLHRKAPELIFQPMFPHASKIAAEPLENRKGIGYVARDGVSVSDHPGLGRFPSKRESWYRVLKPTGRGKEIDPDDWPGFEYGLRHRQTSLLPSVTLIGRPSGDYFTCRWITPIDEQTTLFYTFSLYRRRGRWKTLIQRLQWIAWLGWAHDWVFSDQDKRILEAITTENELLSRTDVGVAAWRRFAAANARRPAADGENAGEEVGEAASIRIGSAAE